jgi:GT2 family glycosyltransferase
VGVLTGSGASVDVELVAVAYRSRPQVEEMLSGLPADLPVVVVDNSDGADGLREVVEARPRGRYLAGGGVGFARAANLGARSSTADVLVFVNPDTRPTTADLAALVDDVAGDPGLAASAAASVGADGRPRIGVAGWEFSVPRALVFGAGLHKRLLPRAGLFARPAAGEQIRVDWVSGAVMAVRREVFLRLGCFDESFYVYCEDVAYGRTARQHGLTSRLRTDVLVHGSSGGSGAPSLEMMRLRGASLNRYVHKFRPRPQAFAISALVAAGYALRTAEQLARRDVRRAREHWMYAVGAVTARATVAGRVVTDR